MPGDVVPDDVCVVGSLNVDLVVRVARHPAPGETVMGTTVETFLGGKGYNQAVAAARAGARTSIVGAVGADGYGDDVLAALAADGVDAGGVRRVAGGTGMAFPVVDDAGQNTIIVVPRANHDVEVTDVERIARRRRHRPRRARPARAAAGRRGRGGGDRPARRGARRAEPGARGR